ncbi:hypothetical protein BGY98DRAFT_980632 [Russula aff. rugulosa BPL654]|nr:hypothetical protein BGY98DRAFT_980632 [Russula aff. rugulosa BPL654]
MIFTPRFPVLFTLAVAIAGVSAQSLSDLDACGQACINTTVSKGYCSSINDTSCVCSNTQFQTTLATCLSNCSSSDLTIAEGIQKETCLNASTSSSHSASGSAAATAKSSSTSSSKSNGATAVEQLPLLSAVIVIAGALMGGAFVL